DFCESYTAARDGRHYQVTPLCITRQKPCGSLLLQAATAWCVAFFECDARPSHHGAELLQPCSAGSSSALGSPGAVAQASSTTVTIRRPAPSSWQTMRPCSSM